MRKIKQLVKIWFILLALLVAVSSSLVAQNYAISMENSDYLATNRVEMIPMVPLSADVTAMGYFYVDDAGTRLFGWGADDTENALSVGLVLNKLRVYYGSLANGGVNVFDNASVTYGWNHFAMSISSAGNTLRTYINGEEVASGQFTTPINPSYFSIGALRINGTWQGKTHLVADDFSVWDITLTESEIQTYIANGVVGTESGLVAYYDFNNPTAVPGGDNTGLTTVTDISGNSYDGTLVGLSLNGADNNWVGGYDPPVMPTVTTEVISGLTHNSATTGGDVTDAGTELVTAKGICWNTTGSPEIGTDDYTTDGTGIGSFVSQLSDLNPSTTYYVRAYATNDVGTSYGAEESFTTLAPPIPLSDWGIYLFIALTH